MDNNGWRFPVSVDPLLGQIATTDREQTIRQSIIMILSTPKGTRFIHPEFGCDIRNFLFQGADYTTLKQMEHAVIDSLNRWEPRIQDLQVTAVADSENPSRVTIALTYAIKDLGAAIQQQYTVGV